MCKNPPKLYYNYTLELLSTSTTLSNRHPVLVVCVVSAPASWAQNEDASVASSSEILFVSAGVPTGASDGDVPPQLCG